VGTKDVADRLRWQVPHCRNLGSPFYAELLTRAADDAEAGGPSAAVAAPLLRLPVEEMLPLRLLGAVHRLVLEGEAPELAAHYPSVGGDGDANAAWPLLRELLASAPARLHELMERSVQTNEVGRSAALVGGFLVVARETGSPLRIREIGSSAGLNLRWDRYRYEAGERAWGDPASPVRFQGVFEEPPPPLELPAQVVDRRGCDRAPIDPATEDGRLTLLSYTWPDQHERFEQLRGALDVAREAPAEIDRADAVDWLGTQLAEPHRGAATVVFHSIVMQYLAEDARAAVRATIEEAGARASAEAPLAWLRMEPGGDYAHVHLTLWPAGEERLLAEAGYHGRPVRWAAASRR
jgi:hypothetical protein